MLAQVFAAADERQEHLLISLFGSRRMQFFFVSLPVTQAIIITLLEKLNLKGESWT